MNRTAIWAALGLLGLASPLQAADIRWAAPVNGDFHVAANWSPAQVPGNGDVAILDVDGAYTVTAGSPVNLQGLSVAVSGATLRLNGTSATLSGNADVAGTLFLRAASFTSADLVVDGTLLAEGLSTLAGAAQNNGLVWARGGNSLGSNLTLNTSLVNAGTLRLESIQSNFASELTINDGFTLNISDTGVLQTRIGTNGPRTIRGNITSQGSIVIADQATFVAAAGQGRSRVESAGAFSLTQPATFSSANAVISGGTFDLTGSTFDQVGGSVTWTGGDIIGNLNATGVAMTVVGDQSSPALLRLRGVSTFVGDVGEEVILWSRGAQSQNANLTFPGDTLVHGEVRLQSQESSFSSDITVVDGFKLVLSSTGRLRTVIGTNGPRNIRGDILSAGSIEILDQVTFTQAPDQTAATLESRGSFTLAQPVNLSGVNTIVAGGTFDLTGSVFDQNGGKFTWIGGDILGSYNARAVAASVVGDQSSAALLRLRGVSTFVGDVGEEVVLWARGAQSENADLNFVGETRVNGELRVQSEESNFTSQVTVENGRTLVINPTGLLRTRIGTNGPRVIRGDVTSLGEIRIEDAATFVAAPTQTRSTITSSGLFSLAQSVTFSSANTVVSGGTFDLRGAVFDQLGGTVEWSGGDILGSFNGRVLAFTVVGPQSSPALLRLRGVSTFAGDVGPEVVLWARGAQSENADLTFIDDTRVQGELRVQSEESNFTSQITVTDGFTLQIDPGGLLRTLIGSNGPRVVRGDILNLGEVRINDAASFVAAPGQTRSTFESRGLFNHTQSTTLSSANTIISGGTFDLGGAVWDQIGGTITWSDGDIVGTLNARVVAFTTVGDRSSPGVLRLRGASTFAGDVGEEVVLWARGAQSENANLTFVGDSRVNGEVRVQSEESNFTSQITVANGQTLFINPTGLLRTRVGTNGGRVIAGNINSLGTIQIEDQVSFVAAPGQGRSTVESGGTFRLIQGATLSSANSVISGGTFDVSAAVFDQIGGTATWTGGDIVGNFNARVVAFTAVGDRASPGAFVRLRGASSFAGDVGAGTTVWARGAQSENANLTFVGDTAVRGEVRMQSQESNFTSQVTVAGGSTLAVQPGGLLRTVIGTNGNRAITGAVDVAGTFHVGDTASFNVGPLRILDGGRLTGVQTLNVAGGVAVTVDGTVDPGGVAGGDTAVLTVNGTINWGPTGEMHVDALNPTAGAGHDRLATTVGNFDGLISVTPLPGQTFADGNRISVITCNPCNGTFPNTDLEPDIEPVRFIPEYLAGRLDLVVDRVATFDILLPAVRAGDVFSATVTAFDDLGAQDPNFVGRVLFSASDLAATLPADATFAAGDAGVLIVPGFTFLTAGQQQLTVFADFDNGVRGNIFFDVTPSDVDAAASLVTVDKAEILANDADVATITVEPRDAFGNPVGAGVQVLGATDLGSLGQAVDNDDGTYTLRLTAGLTAGDATVTITAGGVQLATTADVTLLPPPPAPVITVTGVTDGGSFSGSVTITVDFASGSGVASTELRLDGAPFTSGSTVTGDGVYVLFAAADDVFDQRTEEIITFRLDSLDPTIAITLPGPSPFGAPITPVITATDDVAVNRVEATLNGVAYSPGALVDVEGTHTVTATAFDDANNQASASETFTVDLNAPAITVNSPREGDILDRAAVIDVEVADATAVTTTITVDGQAVNNGDLIGEGDHVLVVTSTDALDRTSVATVNFNVDFAPPIIEIFGVTDGGVFGEPVTPVVQVTDDNLVIVVMTLDGEAIEAGTVVDAPGVHVLSVEATDEAGNRSEAFIEFTLDLSAPIITVEGVDDGEVSPTPVTPVVLVNDPDATVVIRLDGQPFTSGTEVADEGEHTLEVTATDDFGRASNTEVTFTIDLSAPVITVTGVANGGIYAGAVTPVITVDDEDAELTALLDGNGFVSGSIVGEFGVHQLVITVVDGAGNTASLTVDFEIDPTVPLLELLGVEDGAFVREQVVITAVTDADNLALTLDGAAYAEGTPIAGEGPHLIEAEASTGERRAVAALRFTIDFTPPSVAIEGVDDGSFNAVPVTPVIVVSDANLEDVIPVLDGAPFPVGGTVEAEGVHTFEARAVDKAGNDATASVTFTIDRTAPVITVTGVEDGAQYQEIVTPIIDVFDVNPGAVIATLNGNAFESRTAVDVAGVFVLDVTATDLAGNTTVATVRFDITALATDLEVALLFGGQPAAGAVVTVHDEDGALVVGPITVDDLGQGVLPAVPPGTVRLRADHLWSRHIGPSFTTPRDVAFVWELPTEPDYLQEILVEPGDDLQAAIDGAGFGAVVRVAEGSFGDISVPAGVAVHGGFDPATFDPAGAVLESIVGEVTVDGDLFTAVLNLRAGSVAVTGGAPLLRDLVLEQSGADPALSYAGGDGGVLANLLIADAAGDGLVATAGVFVAENVTVVNAGDVSLGDGRMIRSIVVGDVSGAVEDSLTDEEPAFVSGPLHDYYLSQRADGQGADSPGVDASVTRAIDLDLRGRTTATTGVEDVGDADLGYHAWPRTPPPPGNDVVAPGCGCSDTGSPDLAPWLALLGLAALRRRRRGAGFLPPPG
jgi:uncharacterized protein (TIGR03382 family)